MLNTPKKSNPYSRLKEQTDQQIADLQEELARLRLKEAITPYCEKVVSYLLLMSNWKPQLRPILLAAAKEAFPPTWYELWKENVTKSWMWHDKDRIDRDRMRK